MEFLLAHRKINLIKNLMFKKIYLIMPFFYAVRHGRQSGIFNTWKECEQQVKGFRNAVYKKFPTMKDAEDFVGQNKSGNKAVIKELDEQREIREILEIAESKSDEAISKETDEQREIREILECALEEEDMLQPTKKQKLDHTQSNNSNTTLLVKYSDYEFTQDKHGFVQVYTDGSCINNGKKGAIAGLGVFFGDAHPLNLSEPVEGRATNNVGEIQASIKAIQEAEKCGVLRLNILTDSQFLIKSVCEWMKTWKKNKWKLANGEPVKNQKDFKVLDALLASTSMVIKWTYVPAHKGHHGNEIADQLAKEGARQYKLESQ